jgi:hypothetical protein
MKAFSTEVFRKNNNKIQKLIQVFNQAQQLSEQNRYNMKDLLSEMKVQERKLSPSIKEILRPGQKSFNQLTAKEIVLSILKKSKKSLSISDIETEALNNGMVSTSVSGLRSLISKALYELKKSSLIQRIDRGKYRFVR